jgi:hypothetical protein
LVHVIYCTSLAQLAILPTAGHGFKVKTEYVGCAEARRATVAAAREQPRRRHGLFPPHRRQPAVEGARPARPFPDVAN